MINLHPTPPPIDEELFFKIAKIGFSQKRKQLQKNLRQLPISRPQLTDLFTRANIDGSRRAQTLSITEWITLCTTYQTLITETNP